MSNEGKNVKVHYRGTFDDGTEFDSSYKRNQPLTFKCMSGQMIAGFDNAVKDMKVGETVNVRLAPADAYGERDPELIVHFPKKRVPRAGSYQVGDKITLRSGMRPLPSVIIEITDEEIICDANSEMAGKYLNFEITLISAE